MARPRRKTSRVFSAPVRAQTRLCCHIYSTSVASPTKRLLQTYMKFQSYMLYRLVTFRELLHIHDWHGQRYVVQA